MLPCNTIAVFNGNFNRKYYQIHPQIGTKIFHNQYIRYDTAFPLDLALSIRNETEKVGHDYCSICRINGIYNNIAVTLCNNCVQNYPEYSCKCASMCIQSYIEGSLSEGNIVKECSSECRWFGIRGFYRNVNFKTVGIVLTSKSNKDKTMNHNNDEEMELEEGEILSDDDSSVSNFHEEF